MRSAFFNCHSSRSVCRLMPYVLPIVCLHHEPFPLSHSVQSNRQAVASCSCSSRGPVWFDVIVSSSITMLKCDNTICNNKNKLARCHVYVQHILIALQEEWERHKPHAQEQACTQNTCEHHVLLQFVSQTQAGLKFQALWSPKYISKYTSGCVSLLFTGKWFMEVFVRRRKGDMVWRSLRERERN